MSANNSTAFAPGTFSPDPRSAPTGRMIAAQARIESKLFLRHGEQQLLSMIIPFAMLLVLAKVQILDTDKPIDVAFPMILAIAAMSSGFTGQAIALAFDRRYGALKRTGASGVPAWTIILGKAAAVVTMVLIQTILLGGTALVLGWRPDALGIMVGALTLIIGVASFSSLGLLMGGTLSSEVVLALANLIWVILCGLVGWVMMAQGLHDAGWANLIPSVALASGLTLSFEGTIPWIQLLILAVWLLLASVAATKWFRFAA
ncbi:ABC transporter permease [Corynebacterium sp. A21]|uniref:ABC transporter permease n=1 Tax=Corynebacterium sp. A21 TaxID=3457318 RepID=UPI003FD53CC1